VDRRVALFPQADALQGRASDTEGHPVGEGHGFARGRAGSLSRAQGALDGLYPLVLDALLGVGRAHSFGGREVPVGGEGRPPAQRPHAQGAAGKGHVEGDVRAERDLTPRRAPVAGDHEAAVAKGRGAALRVGEGGDGHRGARGPRGDDRAPVRDEERARPRDDGETAPGGGLRVRRGPHLADAFEIPEEGLAPRHHAVRRHEHPPPIERRALRVAPEKRLPREAHPRVVGLHAEPAHDELRAAHTERSTAKGVAEPDAHARLRHPIG
jgi:hypothetical protein